MSAPTPNSESWASAHSSQSRSFHIEVTSNPNGTESLSSEFTPELLQSEGTKSVEANTYEAPRPIYDVPVDNDGPFINDVPRNGDHWEKCYSLAQRDDFDACIKWNSDIDALLVFTGLFAIVVTGFANDAYKWLEPDPSLDILARISSQLANPNTTLPVLPIAFSASPSQQRINILWFLSLTIALMAAVIALLCKQWLREYQRDLSLPYRNALIVRHLRFEALRYWKVESIINALPILLQLSLLLFSVGLIELLYTRDTLVGALVMPIVTIAVLFLVTTTLLPGLVFILSSGTSTSCAAGRVFPPCAYRSAQSWFFLRVWTAFYTLLWHLSRCFNWTFQSRVVFLRRWHIGLRYNIRQHARHLNSSWSGLDKGYVLPNSSVAFSRHGWMALKWLRDRFSYHHPAMDNIYHAVGDLAKSPARLFTVDPEYDEEVYLWGEYQGPLSPSRADCLRLEFLLTHGDREYVQRVCRSGHLQELFFRVIDHFPLFLCVPHFQDPSSVAGQHISTLFSLNDLRQPFDVFPPDTHSVYCRLSLVYTIHLLTETYTSGQKQAPFPLPIQLLPSVHLYLSDVLTEPSEIGDVSERMLAVRHTIEVILSTIQDNFRVPDPNSAKNKEIHYTSVDIFHSALIFYLKTWCPERNATDLVEIFKLLEENRVRLGVTVVDEPSWQRLVEGAEDVIDGHGERRKTWERERQIQQWRVREMQRRAQETAQVHEEVEN